MVRTRNTRQRQLIIAELQATKSHPSAEWIYKRVKAKLPNISLGTVYRNLAVLKDQKLIQELPRVGSQSRYDGNPKPHYHFVCVECGGVEDIETPFMEKLSAEVSKKLTEHNVQGYFAEFYGLCSQCNKSK